MTDELTDSQEHQIDVINNAAFNAVAEALAPLGIEPEWSMEWVGELSDDIADICERYFGKTEAEVYPFIDEESIILEPVYITTPFFWDCGCQKNYIHSKAETVCEVCGAKYAESPQDYPDSGVNEVIKMLARGE